MLLCSTTRLKLGMFALRASPKVFFRNSSQKFSFPDSDQHAAIGLF